MGGMTMPQSSFGPTPPVSPGTLQHIEDIEQLNDIPEEMIAEKNDLESSLTRDSPQQQNYNSLYEQLDDDLAENLPSTGVNSDCLSKKSEINRIPAPQLKTKTIKVSGDVKELIDSLQAKNQKLQRKLKISQQKLRRSGERLRTITERQTADTQFQKMWKQFTQEQRDFISMQMCNTGKSHKV